VVPYRRAGSLVLADGSGGRVSRKRWCRRGAHRSASGGGQAVQ
jgi:hypothetical protein